MVVVIGMVLKLQNYVGSPASDTEYVDGDV